MALVLKDRVKESSTSSGTGSITLGGAAVGFQTFNSAVASGSTVYYTIHNTTVGNDQEWEVGVGTFTAPSTLSRDTVFSSSTGGSKVSFSGSSVLEVFITQPAEEAVYINQATGKVEAFGNGTNSISFVNVTADLFTGNASAISAINASNISSGTIDNARTTAASANGASTIVARGTSGEFSAGAITSTSISGNGVALTAINASNISSGTIDNARTTAASANGASTIVQRDSGGNFSANTVTAAVIGDLSGGSAINASNISSGTIANARTTASDANGANTIVSRDANGSFTANVVTATTISGNGSSLTGINASNISSGTIANARTTASSANGASTIVLRDAAGDFAADAITANFFIGDGSNVSAINGSNVTTGTVANARTTAASANGASTIVARDSNGSFAANVGTFTSVSGNGAALTGINASNLSAGTVSSDRVSGSYTGITGVGTLTAGTWNANVVSAQYGGTGSANLTADSVVLGNGANAVKVVAPGTANNVLTSNGTTWISQAPTGGGGGGFAAGTVMLFGQTAAPTGWTKDTTNYNNSALRVVTGTASTGGSVDFTTAFASQTPTGSVSITAVSGSAGATTLSTPQIPSHTHTIPSLSNGGAFGSGLRYESAPSQNTGATGGGGSHTHPFSFSSGSGTFSGNAIDLAVKYVDVIRATKD